MCPKNLIGSWEDEIEKHLTKDYSFTIKNYEWVRTHTAEIIADGYDFIIVDESHRIKNRRAKTTKALWKLRGIKYRLILSGTPIPKDEIDLWSQYKFLNSHIWGERFNSFADNALKEIDMGGYFVYKTIKSRMKPLMERAAKYTYRVKLDDMVDLPGMVNIEIPFYLKGSQKKNYQELQNSFMTHHKGLRASIDLSVTGLIRLHQLSGGHLVLETRDVVRYKDQQKLWWILDKLEDLNGQPLIIFCRYSLEIDLIAEALKRKRYKFAIMRGGMKNHEISAVRRGFQKGKFQILIGQIECIKEGNNFQHCRYSVFYSKSLSSVALDQCKKRTYRNGQTKKCVYWHLITKNTIEEDYERILKMKGVNAEKILIRLASKRIGSRPSRKMNISI